MRLRNRAIATLTFIAMSLCQLGSAADSITRTTAFGDLALSQSQMAELVQTIDSFLRRANGAIKECGEEHPIVQYSDGITKTSFPADQIEAKHPRIADVTTTFDLSYHCSACPESNTVPVTRITISLADYGRISSIEGFSSDQVESLDAVISSKLNDHKIIFGGNGFRSFVGLVLMVAAIMAVAFVVPRLTQRYGIVIVLAMLPLTYLFGLSSDKLLTSWFPGFAIYAGEVSVIRRYSPEIGVLGLLVSILASSVPLVKKFAKGAKVGDHQT